MKEHHQNRWGRIVLPTISSLVNQLMDYADAQRISHPTTFQWSDLRVGKSDLSKAFSLLSFRPADVPLLACEMYQDEWAPPDTTILHDYLVSHPEVDPSSSHSWSIVYTTGLFGLSVMPFVFGVASRVLEFCLQCAIHGSVSGYVDDMMFITLLKHSKHDICALTEVIETLLGPDALEWTKTFCALRVDWIGYTVDLTTQLVTIARHNFLKILHGFFVIDETALVTVRTLSTLAAWSSRYTTILISLTPLTSILYREFHGHTDLNHIIPVSPLGRSAIWVWRAALICLDLNESTFAAPFKSFRLSSPTYEVNYDSCLTGTGFVIREYSEVAGTGNLITIGQFPFGFDCHADSGYQNTSEFLAIVAAITALTQLGISNVTLHLVGDSITSLAWSSLERFTGVLCQRASIVYMLLATTFNIRVASVTHIPGTENVLCDRLSRYDVLRENLGYPSSSLCDCGVQSIICSMVHLCDPTNREHIITEESFLTFWSSIHVLLDQVRL